MSDYLFDLITNHMEWDHETEEDNDLDYDEPDERDEWGCEFGDRCLMPSYNHLRSECYTREMAEAWADEQQNNPA